MLQLILLYFYCKNTLTYISASARNLHNSGKDNLGRVAMCVYDTMKSVSRQEDHMCISILNHLDSSYIYLFARLALLSLHFSRLTLSADRLFLHPQGATDEDAYKLYKYSKVWEYIATSYVCIQSAGST